MKTRFDHVDCWEVVLSILYSVGITASATVSTSRPYTAPAHVYHSHEDLTVYLRSIVAAFPQQAYLYNIGKSVQDRELWVLAISGKYPDRHVTLRPELKYVGNMHGNEAVGRELLVQFIHYLVTGYGTIYQVTNLLSSSRVHILVSMNPDGFQHTIQEFGSQEQCNGDSGRRNAKNVDLNRNFPDYFQPELDESIREPETNAIMEWLAQHQFVLSANLHGGALVANYPYDNSKHGKTEYSSCPDDDVFRQLASAYSFAHTEMYTGHQCGENFTDGITNGAHWYAIKGGMQDYNYLHAGCMEITLEVGCCKYLTASSLESYWNENRPALMALMQQANIGVKGQVFDEFGIPVKGARMWVEGRKAFTQNCTNEGEFWRLLLPGQYTIQVRADGYNPRSISVIIPVNQAEPIILNILMLSYNIVHVDIENAAIAPQMEFNIYTVFGMFVLFVIT